MKAVVIRADGSDVIGSGHTMRCLALADALVSKGIHAIFVTRDHPGHLSATIRDRGHQVCILPVDGPQKVGVTDVYEHWLGASQEFDARQTLKVAMETSASCVVVDHYAIDAPWEQSMRASGLKVFVIEDLEMRRHDCDWLIDSNLYETLPPSYRRLKESGTQVLVGPRYALLHRSYLEQRRRTQTRRGRVQRVLVYFGGTDQNELTEKVVKCLISIGRDDVAVDVVVGAAYPSLRSLVGLIDERPNFSLHRFVPSLAPLMAKADLAIGAAGTTSWERLCLWLPAIVISIAENQIPNAKALSTAGCIDWIGHLNVDDHDLSVAISRQLEGTIEEMWPDIALTKVDGGGADRAVDAMLSGSSSSLTMRKANSADEAMILEWANDPFVRKTSFAPTKISVADHRSWFAEKLSNPEVLLLIGEMNGVPFGQVRLDQTENFRVISYSIIGQFRGRGLASHLLKLAFEVVDAQKGPGPLLAKVRSDNVASCRVFDGLGFDREVRSDGVLIFTRPASAGERIEVDDCEEKD